MGTIQYSDERDKTLFSNASLAIGKLITGSNNQQGLDALKKIFLKHVESVTFTHFNERERKDLGNTSTIGSIRINCIGLHGATTLNQYRKVKHTIFHELLHAHVAAIQREKTNTYSKNGKNYISVGGYICNADDLKKEGNKRVYGLYLMEALTELLTEVAMVSFDEQHKMNNPNVNPNIILHEKSYKRSVHSKYDDYIPLAKLMIAVFSNWDRADYNKIIENYNTIGICSLNIETDTNKVIKANDLLYGYMYNPIHTLQQYESIMGDNSYISLITQFDRIKRNGVIDKSNVELILRNLSKYATYKISKLVKNNTLSNEEGMRILNNIRSNDEKYKTIL